jgi:hypothetical protein
VWRRGFCCYSKFHCVDGHHHAAICHYATAVVDPATNNPTADNATATDDGPASVYCD